MDVSENMASHSTCSDVVSEIAASHDAEDMNIYTRNGFISIEPYNFAMKRQSIESTSSSSSSKKRRKQSFPVRIPLSTPQQPIGTPCTPTSSFSPSTAGKINSSPENHSPEESIFNQPSLQDGLSLTNLSAFPYIANQPHHHQLQQQKPQQQLQNHPQLLNQSSNQQQQQQQQQLQQQQSQQQHFHQQQHQQQTEQWVSDPAKHEDLFRPTSLPDLPLPTFRPNELHSPALAAIESLRMARPVRQPLRIFNPDAYCEICNKEFCNKYFLKTHKANKHGIYSDLTPNEISLGAIYAETFLVPNLKIPPAAAIIEQPSVITSPVKLPETSVKSIISPQAITCDICLKKFNNIKRHKAKTHGIVEDGAKDQEVKPIAETSNTPAPEMTPSPTSRTFSSAEFEEEGSLPDTPRKSSPSSLSGQQTHPLRRLRLVKSEAFCDICCKEYCNKYFLRTHKMKRHGIILLDDTQKENRPEDSNITNGHTQSSPLNLIISSQNTNSSEYYAENVKNESSAEEELICMICGIQLRHSLAMAHFERMHPDWLYSRTSNSESAPKSVSPPALAETPVVEYESEYERVPEKKDTISEDLQKLQSMILQLTDIKNNTMAKCSICNSDLKNRYHLQAHMITKHGDIFNERPELLSNMIPSFNNNGLKTSESDTPETTKMQREDHPPPFVQSKPMSFAGLSLPQDVKDEKPAGKIEGGNSEERRTSSMLTPISSYCEICNKELCNKYFMRTHMQRMHGIELENGVHIGGVVCNICNKELCSKYFLRVHKQNTHGIIEDGAPLIQTQPPNEELSNEATSSAAESVPSQLVDHSLKPADFNELSNRYFTHFTEVCPICSRRFRSSKWLSAHLLSDHGKEGRDKWEEIEKLQAIKNVGENDDKFHSTPKVDEDAGSFINSDLTTGCSNIFGLDEITSRRYFCSFCNFSSPVLAFLFMHERTHTSRTTRTNEFLRSVISEIFPGDKKGQSGSSETPSTSKIKETPELVGAAVESPKVSIMSMCDIKTESMSKSVTPSFSKPKLPVKSPVLPDSTLDMRLDVVATGAFGGAEPFMNSKRRFDFLAPNSNNNNNNNNNSHHNNHNNNNSNNTNNNNNNNNSAPKMLATDRKETVSASPLAPMTTSPPLPTLYGLPQGSQPACDGGVDAAYKLQSFMLEETLESGENAVTARMRFVPALVFLPVRELLTDPETVSFTLTPTGDRAA